ncbi:hypothetical protein, partial [Kitasatospora griseola]|uniref:hypothetical protein n=1 Tax=Kitasatospora griseola TaxID=2064 RepID=UPI001E5FF10E
MTAPEVGTPAPSGTAPAPSGSTSQEEDELRARLRQLIAEPGHGQYFHEEAGKALNGTVEDMRHFFDVLPTIIIDDRDIFITQVMSMSDHRGQLWRTIQNALSGTRADRDHFLDVTWPAVRLQYLKDAARIAGGSDPQLAARARQVMEANDGGKALVGFIEVEVPKAANDANWRKVLQTLIRPGSSLTLDEAAGQALGVDGAKAFLAGLDG